MAHISIVGEKVYSNAHYNANLPFFSFSGIVFHLNSLASYAPAQARHQIASLPNNDFDRLRIEKLRRLFDGGADIYSLEFPYVLHPFG